MPAVGRRKEQYFNAYTVVLTITVKQLLCLHYKNKGLVSNFCHADLLFLYSTL
jgi:hypothetical protein